MSADPVHDQIHAAAREARADFVAMTRTGATGPNLAGLGVRLERHMWGVYDAVGEALAAGLVNNCPHMASPRPMIVYDTDPTTIMCEACAATRPPRDACSFCAGPAGGNRALALFGPTKIVATVCRACARAGGVW